MGSGLLVPTRIQTHDNVYVFKYGIVGNPRGVIVICNVLDREAHQTGKRISKNALKK